MDKAHEPSLCLNMDSIMEFISSQRHEFLNHFQVIMGLLQLNKKEEAIEYIKKASEGLQQASRAGRVPWPELAAVLTLREKKVRECGNCLNLSIGQNLEQIAKNPSEAVEIIDRMHHLICEEMRNCGPGVGNQLDVKVFEDKGKYGISFSWERPMGREVDKLGLLGHPVMEQARRLMSKVEISEEGRQLTLTMFFPQGKNG